LNPKNLVLSTVHRQLNPRNLLISIIPENLLNPKTQIESGLNPKINCNHVLEGMKLKKRKGCFKLWNKATTNKVFGSFIYCFLFLLVCLFDLCVWFFQIFYKCGRPIRPRFRCHAAIILTLGSITSGLRIENHGNAGALDFHIIVPSIQSEQVFLL
jgi:hypothetical protein